jgi:hypothetical protein
MNEELPAGRYYIGDPCNALKDEIYTRIWGAIYDYKEGKFTINDNDFLVHSTHGGDGTFYDHRKRKYIVKSGMISVISMELIDSSEEKLKECKINGIIITFNTPFQFIYDAGIFYIQSDKKFIEINTRNEEEYLSECEDHCYNTEGQKMSDLLENRKDLDDDEDEDIEKLDFESDDGEEDLEIEKEAEKSKSKFGSFFK